jgi:excisionase family DNA binding protein
MGLKGTNRNKQVLTKFPRDGVATVPEAALFLKCGESTIYKLINEGVIKTVPLGSEKRIAWSFLRSYIGEPVAAG